MTTLARALSLAGVGCLAVITLASPGATRMWATPWTLALWTALLLPALALSVRAFDTRSPLALPSRGWLGGALATAAIVLASALASPYRELSLRWSAPLLGGLAMFFVAFDWLHASADGRAQRGAVFAKAALLAGLALGIVSLGLWGEVVARAGLRAATAARNAFPLGHSNYTAGLALLMLPLAASGIWRHRGGWRIIAGVTAALALAMLFSSGSRGGLIGLAALAAATLGLAPLTAKAKGLLAAAAAVVGLVFIMANPRTRATFTGGADRHLVAASTTQRSAMFSAGAFMGAARPLLGWGPGTTPLVYPRYRARLAGGAENVLQLHSTPVHAWAELGAAGVGGLLVFGFLVFQNRQRAPTAALTLAGYGAFALTDWQLDIPVFAAALATGAALLAPASLPGDEKPKPAARFAVGAGTLLAIALIAFWGRRDPAPELNVRALALARDPVGGNRAIALLRSSLALNPDQEIAHFNLGWLLVTREPTAAERHFRAAARLVPDKGGVYFGLGLALLNQGNRDAAAQAFALECVNDPAFLVSPWWREPSVAELREATAAALTRQRARLQGLVSLPVSFSPDLLARAPAAGPERNYRRERTGYPVLMRNLDLPAPIDLFDVREPAAIDPSLGALPPKGAVPSPLLLELLDTFAPAHPESSPALHR